MRRYLSINNLENEAYIEIKGVHLRISGDTMIDSAQRDSTESRHSTFEL